MSLIAAIVVAFFGLTDVYAVDFGKIMPLGDSITNGYQVDGGYRDPLYQQLTAAGHTLEFVGTNNEYPTTLLIANGQNYHEGHNGYTVMTVDPPYEYREGIYDHITGWMAATDPDIILLMIGTNDSYVYNDRIPVEVADHLDLLLERIFTNKPTVKLIWATIIPCAFPQTQTNLLWINSQIPAIAASHKTMGRDIELVPMYDALTLSDLADGAHPNQAGYNKMSQVWYGAMTSHTIATGVNVSAETDNSAAAGFATASTYTSNTLGFVRE